MAAMHMEFIHDAIHKNEQREIHISATDDV